MAYGFDEKSPEAMDSKFIETGIQENLELKEWKFAPAVGGDQPMGAHVEIVLVKTDEAGNEKTANRRYFEPSLGEYNKTEEDLAKAQVKFSRVIKNFCTKFLGDKYEIPAAPSFEGFCKKAIADVGTKYKGVKLRALIVYNNGGFPTLRSFSPVVELMSVPLAQTKLKVTEPYDVVTAPVKKGDATAGPTNTGLKPGENIF